MTTLEKVRTKRYHKQLSKYKYFYYELNQSLVTDYEYDKLEKKYDKLCDRCGVPEKYRVSNIVGAGIICRNPFNLMKIDASNKRNKRKAK